MIDYSNYPFLQKYTVEMTGDSKYEALGTEEKEEEILSKLNKKRIKSIVLKGLPGVGKTQVVETIARKNKNFLFLSADIDTMGGKGNNVLGENIKGLIKEITQLDKKIDRDVVLFIDEFHKVGMPGYDSGIDGFKTALARGELRLIAATTLEEFTKYIEHNQALIERLGVVTIDELPDKYVEKILCDMWEKELKDEEPLNMDLVKKIVEYGKYLPSKANPRKSIDILDDMIGIYNTKNVSFNETLLDKVIYDSSRINPKIRPNIYEIEKELKRRIKGQPDAIRVLVDSLHLAMAGLLPPGAPMGSFIFMGPTGVGKTETAKVLAEQLFGSEKKMLRYDMSEYQGASASDKFKDDIADDIGRNPYSIILCDEAEKADRGVMDLHLQITSDGRLTNRYGREVTFENAYIIYTTNIGFKSFEKHRSLNVEVSKSAYDTDKAGKILQSADGINGFRPEFVNRMTGIVTFNALEPETKKEIVEDDIKAFKEQLQEQHGVYLEYSDRVITYLYKEGVSDASSSGGGRDIKNRIRNYLHVTVAKVINKYLLDTEKQLTRIKVEPLGELINERQDKVNSTAQLSVLEYDVYNKDGRIETHRGFEHKNVNKAYDALHQLADVSYKLINI